MRRYHYSFYRAPRVTCFLHIVSCIVFNHIKTLHSVISLNEQFLFIIDNLKPLGELDFSTNGSAIIAEKWRQWKQTMQLFIKLTMTRSSEKEKCSAFLYVIGQAGQDIYNTMNLTEEETGKINILFTIN